MFEYNGLYSRFVFTSSYNAQSTNPNISIVSLPVAPGEVNLAYAMGFSTMGYTSMQNNKWRIEADSGPTWRGNIAVSPGFYTGDLAALGSDMSLQFNRLQFDSSDFLLFSNAIGLSINVPIPIGRYLPNELAQFLTAQMNTLDPNSNQNSPSPSANIYLVVWNANEDPEDGCCGNESGYFVFSCNGLCGLEFSEAAVTGSTFALRTGFNNLAYRNGPSYRSIRRLTFPVIGTGTFKRFNSLTVQILANNARRGYRIDPTLAKAISCGVQNVTATGITIITSGPSTGYQVNDVLALAFPVSSIFNVNVRVLSIINSVSFVVETINGLPWPAFPAWPSIDVSTSLAKDSALLNVYFNFNGIPNSRRTHRSIYPVILGFDYNDLLGPAPFISITTASLEPPPYLLLQVLDIKGSSYIQHNYQGENLTNIFAKVVFFPSFQMQRMYPMSQTLNGSEMITNLHFRWLNPDHTLYNFRGRNWSATIEFVIMSEVPVLMCG